MQDTMPSAMVMRLDRPEIKISHEMVKKQKKKYKIATDEGSDGEWFQTNVLRMRLVAATPSCEVLVRVGQCHFIIGDDLKGLEEAQIL